MYCILVIVVAVSLDCVWFAVCFLVLTKWGKVSAGSRHGVRVRHGFLAGLFHDLVVIQPLTSIWVAFGMGKKYRFYHINNICRSLGGAKSLALLMFRAYSGCDTTSAFSGKVKKLTWRA